MNNTSANTLTDVSIIERKYKWNIWNNSAIISEETIDTLMNPYVCYRRNKTLWHKPYDLCQNQAICTCPSILSFLECMQRSNSNVCYFWHTDTQNHIGNLFERFCSLKNERKMIPDKWPYLNCFSSENTKTNNSSPSFMSKCYKVFIYLRKSQMAFVTFKVMSDH